MLVAIGAGDIGMKTVLTRIRALNAPPEKIATELPLQQPVNVSQQKSGSYINIEGVGNLLTLLARCCQPIPGDPIIGYITKGRGVSIHHEDCRNIKAAQKFRCERTIDVKWGTDSPQKYPVALVIEAEDRPGLIRDISSVITTEKITILGLNSRVNKLKNRAYITLTVEINQLELLDKLLRDLRKISEVIIAQRKK